MTIVEAWPMPLVDSLTDESVSFEPGLSADKIIKARVAEADHPRADFRSRPLVFELVDESGRTLDPSETVAATDTVKLLSPEAGDVIARRDRWLTDIEARGQATTSVSTSTHLALIERSGSRLDDVHRLRASLQAQRVAAPPPSTGASLGGRSLLLVALGAVVLVLIAGTIWVTRPDDGVTDDGVTNDGATGDGVASEVEEGEGLALPIDMEMELVQGTTNRTAFQGQAGQNVVVLMLAPIAINRPGIDAELELLDADGNQIGYNDDRQDVPQGGPRFNGLNSRIDITLPADGVYTVVSGDLSDSSGGRYELLIEEGGEGGTGFTNGQGEIPAQAVDGRDRGG